MTTLTERIAQAADQQKLADLRKLDARIRHTRRLIEMLRSTHDGYIIDRAVLLREIAEPREARQGMLIDRVA